MRIGNITQAITRISYAIVSCQCLLTSPRLPIHPWRVSVERFL